LHFMPKIGLENVRERIIRPGEKVIRPIAIGRIISLSREDTTSTQCYGNTHGLTKC